MKKTRIVLIILLALSVITFLGYSGWNYFLPKKLEPRVYSKESSTAGVVEVTAVPKELSAGREMIFTLDLNNHSMELDYDYTEMAIVVDNEGNIYRPTRWIGGSGGHHVSGDLIFEKLSGKAKSVGLNIKGIDNKNVVFDWEL